jgi:hypothetical protein
MDKTVYTLCVYLEVSVYATNYHREILILLCVCVLILHMWPHTTACVRILLYLCPHTTVHVSSCYYMCVLALLYVSSYYICVLMLLHMCPHTAANVSSYYCMCPHTTICVSSYYRCVLILLHVCPRTTTYIAGSLHTRYIVYHMYRYYTIYSKTSTKVQQGSFRSRCDRDRKDLFWGLLYI